MVGGVLIFDGFKGRSAWGDFLAIIRGQDLSSGTTTTSAGGGGASSNLSTGNTNDGTNIVNKVTTIAEQRQLTQNNLTQLTDINGVPMSGMYLKADAAAAFQRAQKRVGRTIPLTSGWRAVDGEIERNKKDAKRFPVPNEHTAANAIDVWGDTLEGWANAPARDTTVRAALYAEGFKQWNPDGWDFMHFSYGVAR